jgi:hypothetical protein
VPGALLNGFPPLLQFSCNGQDWVGYWQPNSTISVNIERADAGCPAGDGQRTLRFRWSVNSDWSSEVTAPVEWSSTRALTINLTKDLMSPIASAPSVRIAASGSMSAGKAPLQVAWSGSDAGSGIARYEIARSIDGASWTLVSTTATSPSLSTHLSTGHEYRFRVRAIDKAGNVSAWATGSKFRLSGYSEASSRISYSGTWSVASSASYWGGKARYSKSAGARATFTFTGRSLAWIAAKGPTRGSARVYVNGTLVSTVNLNSSGTSTARIVFTKSWSSSATRTVQIRVTGTSGHPRVDVDGFLVGS